MPKDEYRALRRRLRDERRENLEDARRSLREVLAGPWSMAALARELRVRRTAVQQWSTGRRPIPERYAAKLAELAGVSRCQSVTLRFVS